VLPRREADPSPPSSGEV